jgi:hypothetical protein
MEIGRLGDWERPSLSGAGGESVMPVTSGNAKRSRIDTETLAFQVNKSDDCGQSKAVS